MNIFHAHIFKNIFSKHKIILLIVASRFIFCFSINAQDRQYMLNNSVGFTTADNLGKTPEEGTISFNAMFTSKERFMDAFTTGSLTGFSGGLNAIRFEFAPSLRTSSGFNVCIGDKNSNELNHGNQYNYLTPSEINLNTWYHFAFTWNMKANNAKGYVNGKEVFNYTTTFWPDYFSSIIIGAGFDTTRKWSGGLDQILIWKKELTKKEIERLEPGNINFYDPELIFNAADYAKSQSVLGIQATCFCQDSKGFIWIGTTAGLRKFDGVNYRYFTANLQKKDALHSNYIASVFEDSHKRLWVGTYDDGIYLLDRLTDKFFPYKYTSSKEKKTITNIGEDNQKKLWIKTGKGFYTLNETTNSFEINNNIEEGFYKKFGSAFKDENGNFWCVSKEGLKFYNTNLKKEYDSINNPEKIPILNISSIQSITTDKQNNLWACDGLKPLVYKYNIGTKKINIYSFPNDLEMDNKRKVGKISSGKILADKYDNIWLSLPGIGLSKFNNSSNKFSIAVKDNNSYGFYDSFFVNRTNSYPMLRDNEGNLWVGGFTNFIFFHPVPVSASIHPADVTITSIESFDEQLYVNPQKITMDSSPANKLSFHIKQGKLFNIQFASLQYSHADKTVYHLKMQGYDSAWVDPTVDKMATYIRLPEGHYFFRVKCENQFGIACENETVVEIFVDPPYWQTWWAYSLYVLVTGGIIYAIYYKRVQQLRKKQAAQLSLMIATQEQERKRISRDLHDDVGTRLSALKLFLSSLHEKAVETNNEEIKRLAANSELFVKETIKDVRELLLNLSPSVLEEFGYTIAVEGLINKINETKQIHFSLVVFGMKERLKKEYELALYRITQELINNVLKHAEAKNVSLQIGKRDNKIILMLEDDGKGFDITAHKDGYGLHNLDARTKLLQGTLTIDSQPGQGTSVLIEIPDNFN
ncbi:MAG: two-component regulator propeller domain-containing protein [Ginsengibacter sp.]